MVKGCEESKAVASRVAAAVLLHMNGRIPTQSLESLSHRLFPLDHHLHSFEDETLLFRLLHHDGLSPPGAVFYMLQLD